MRLSRSHRHGVAGHAISARGNVSDTLIEGCEIAECGAGGIYVGGTRATIHNNHVHGIGRFYPSAIGIYHGGRDCVVSHNKVHDCSYSAINYGGLRNIIEDNLLYDCMKVLHDGAAIYLFGGKECILRRNVARDFVDTGGYGASAYYLDEQSTNCVVEQNLSLRVGWPSHNHMATNNVIRNNVFIVPGDAKWTFPRSTGFTVEKNVLHATGKIRIEGVNAVANWSRNLFFTGAGKIELLDLKDYSRTGQREGPPGDTVVADPLFVDWENGDYRFRPDSPAHKLGIAPLDVSRAGRIRR
ncbi:MAG: right-handed parallel beta-helix repeat-containing protein [Verrucomicrobia bacterium]|nr:right-handed parallel beta-helix repeat-containing protein [Verrucomicrobiota bacterium]